MDRLGEQPHSGAHHISNQSSRHRVLYWGDIDLHIWDSCHCTGVQTRALTAVRCAAINVKRKICSFLGGDSDLFCLVKRLHHGLDSPLKVDKISF